MTPLEFLQERLDEERFRIVYNLGQVAWIRLYKADGTLGHTSVAHSFPELDVTDDGKRLWTADGTDYNEESVVVSDPFYDSTARLKAIEAWQAVLEALGKVGYDSDPSTFLLDDVLLALLGQYEDHEDFDPEWVERD